MVYYIMYQGNVTGPMTKEQMLAYNVNKDTMVSANGGEWRALYTYPELMELLANNGLNPSRGSYQRQISFGEAIKICFTKKYCCFHGRASRAEFWWWQLFTAIIGFALSMIIQPFSSSAAYDMMLTGYFDFSALAVPCTITGLVNLALLLPSLGVTVRRLHDTGRSGWWYLLNFICCIGYIILLVWYCQPSQEGVNDYGEEPYME